MLTYNEKQCIKYLHKEDPIQWNIHTLSESFPATPDIILKVLKSRCRIQETRIEKMDTRVQQNWKLLEEGKLDASPEVIEHLKKFINRREVLLEQIKNSNFYLPEVKKEKVWNNGEMNNILKSYEKSITKLEKNFNNNKKQLASGEIKPLELEAGNVHHEQQNHIKISSEKISKQEMDHQRKESFVLSEMCRTFKRLETNENLKNDISHKSEAMKKFSSTEKAISKYELDKKETLPLNFKQDKISQKDQEGERSFNKNNKKLPKSLFNKETSVVIEGQPSTLINNAADLVKKLQQKYPNSTKSEILKVPLPDENTTLISEVNINKNLGFEPVKKEVFKREASRLRFEELVKDDPERLKRDELYYEREANAIKDTAFWGSDHNSSTKALLEFEKRPVGEPKNINEITRANISAVDKYPEKIKIPKSKRGSGLIFKVRDCYYDDDGEFLYRVPGMVK